MKPLDKNDAINLINAIFPSMELNHINDYEYVFIEPKNPVIKRNVGRLIFKSDETEISLDIYDNSPSSWSIFKLKVKLHGHVVLIQSGEYDNISFKVNRETDFYEESKMLELVNLLCGFDGTIEL
ncbi:MAG: hypothetical protein J6A37_14375 [Oscillospiraceae bacterium]|nr:hypothetical protein [Oscillospiraceae bacterium]